MHLNQLAIDASIAGAVIGDQFPEWRGLAVIPVNGSGTVNAIFRVGSGLAARFPLQPADVALARAQLEEEASASTEFASVSPFTSALPVAIGQPSNDFPMPWSVQSWVDGEVATPTSVTASPDFAGDLAELILALRAAPTLGRVFRGRGRGGDLRDHDEWMEVCLTETEALMEVEPLRAMWSRFRGLPGGARHVMSHSDLTPFNVINAGDRLGGVLDAGWFGPADPSLDLVSAWHLLDGPARAVLRERIGAEHVEWERGRAWAFVQAMGLFWYYRTTNPSMHWLGRSTLTRLIADEELAVTQ